MPRLWRRQQRPGRVELIQRKHRIAGEITMLSAEVRRLQESGRPAGAAEQRLARLRSDHYRTRLEIDRSE
ncbi:MAG: hypothetical protein ACR2P0_10385 [Acidimicrobiales bacterium]